MGKERGYLLYDEVNDILPAEVHSSEEIDDLLSTFERYGIESTKILPAAKAALCGCRCCRNRRAAKKSSTAERRRRKMANWT